jgi:alginate O-acetyltransferase complex protein AlgF
MTIARRPLFQGLISIALFAAAPAIHAQALYAAAPPPGSTFVRVSNGTAVAGVPASIGGQPLPGLPPFTASNYVFLEPGDIEVAIADQPQTFSFAADHYYTVAHTADGTKLFDLKGFSSQLKSMVVLFNLLPDATLSLKTADGKTTVFADVAPYTAVQREINPLTVQLALFKGDQKVMDVPAKSFERGQPSSLVVAGSSSAPNLAWEVQQ